MCCQSQHTLHPFETSLVKLIICFLHAFLWLGASGSFSFMIDNMRKYLQCVYQDICVSSPTKYYVAISTLGNSEEILDNHSWAGRCLRERLLLMPASDIFLKVQCARVPNLYL